MRTTQMSSAAICLFYHHATTFLNRLVNQWFCWRLWLFVYTCALLCPTWQPSLLRRCSASPWRCERRPRGCSGGPAARGSRCPSLLRSRRPVQRPYTWCTQHTLHQLLLFMSSSSSTRQDIQTKNILAIRLLGLGVLQVDLRRGDVREQLSHLRPGIKIK